MSSNKTDAGKFMYNRNFAKSTGISNNQETVIPDVFPGVIEKCHQPNVGRSYPVEPVVGFLYSISKNGFGEFWPLHIGKNQIGRDSDNSICLKEKTVSGKHAILFIRHKQSGAHELIAQIQDVGSKNGIFVNGEDPGFDTAPCSNGDIIRIGKCYSLFLILINPEQIGLSVSEDFTSCDDESEDVLGEEIEMNSANHFSSGATESIDGVYDDLPGVTR